MMSFATTNLTKLVKQQTVFKLKAFSSVFTTLILLQIIAILFSFNGFEMHGSGTNNIFLYISYYSADVVIIFTMLWAFITAILITTKAYRKDDFTFVTNRLSSNLSNIVFLFVASVFGGITALLSRYVLRVIMFYQVEITPFKTEYFIETTSELLAGGLATTLYVLLFIALGYVTGTLVQVNKMFIALLPAGYVGLLILGAKMRNDVGNAVIEFFGEESSLALFTVKILITTILFFGSAIVLSNRLEVK